MEFKSFEKLFKKDFSKLQIVAICAATLLFILKCFRLILHPTLWAEDGPIFYTPLLTHSPIRLSGFFEVYANQLWFFNHLSASVVRLLSFSSINNLPLSSTIYSLTVAICCAGLWLSKNELVKNKGLRVAIFGYILLAPSSFEVLGTVTNIHDYLLLGSLAFVGWGDLNPRRKIIYNLILVLNLFTSVNSIFVVFIVVYRFMKYGSKNKLLLTISLVSLACQIPLWLNRTKEKSDLLSVNLHAIPQIFTHRIIVGSVLGQNGGIRLQNWKPSLFFTIFILILVMIYFNLKQIKLSKSDKPKLVFTLLLAVYVCLCLISGSSGGLDNFVPFQNCGRYFYVIGVIQGVAILSFFDSRRIKISKTLIVICLLGAGVLSDFPIHSRSTPELQSAWSKFEKCVNVGASNCSAIIAPGSPWTIDYKLTQP